MAQNRDKNVKAIRQMFRDAFERLGGVDYLVEFAQANDQNARVFVQAIAKLIPQEITGKDGSPITIVVKKEGLEFDGNIIDGKWTEEVPSLPTAETVQ